MPAPFLLKEALIRCFLAFRAGGERGGGRSAPRKFFRTGKTQERRRRRSALRAVAEKIQSGLCGAVRDAVIMLSARSRCDSSTCTGNLLPGMGRKLLFR